MIISRCGNCQGQDIKGILCLIDERLSQFGGMLYVMDAYGVKRDFDQTKFDDLFTFKEILIKCLYNESYSDYPLERILSKVKSIVNVTQ